MSLVKPATATVLGNGPSRQSLPWPAGGTTTIYGCNAAYRGISGARALGRARQLNFIVAIDDGMIAELKEAEAAGELIECRMRIPPEDDRWEPEALGTPRRRGNAGISAVLCALADGHTIIECLGFDFLMRDPAASVGNLFDGTLNYGPETRAKAEDNPGRLRYLGWVADRHPRARFVFKFPASPEAAAGFARIPGVEANCSYELVAPAERAA